MFGWADFEREAPSVAAAGRELIARYRYLLAGTIRSDGTPRISPVEAHLVDGALVLALEAGTLKVRDLRRDPRIVLNAPIVDPDDPELEFKMRGRAVPISAGEPWATAAEAIERASGWRPGPEWYVVSIDIDDAAAIAWRDGEMTMDLWRRGRGIEHRERRIALGSRGS